MINWKGAVVLLLLVAGLGVYLFQTRSQPPPAGASGKTFLACRADETTELTMTATGTRALEMKRPTKLSNWTIVAPRPGPARDGDVDALLSGLHLLTPADTIVSPAPGADYGFDAPYLTVACREGSGVSSNLSVGKQSFDGSSRYARLAGDPKVYVLSGAEVDRLDQFLDQPHNRPSPIPSGPSPSPTT